jgi:hypothetical protein
MLTERLPAAVVEADDHLDREQGAYADSRRTATAATSERNWLRSRTVTRGCVIWSNPVATAFD